MDAKTINRVYDDVCSKISKYKLRNVRVPQLKDSMGKFNVSGLSFVFFYSNLSKIVTKADLTLFLRKFGHCTINPPNPRHFGLQYGFYFLVRGSYHPRYRRVLKPGEYSLYSITKEHPNILQNQMHHRTVKLNKTDFIQIKERYDRRCANCGSQEDAPNFKNKTIRTVLEMGHMDPNKQLTVNNCIPMCCICNQVYKNRFVFNSRGIITKHLL